jgi:subtilase family serine protease
MIFFIFALFNLGVTLIDARHLKIESMIHRPDFNRLRRSPAEVPHEVVFAIRQNNLETLEQMVLERSTPGSPQFQKWMNFDEVAEIIANSHATDSVMTWLLEHSVNITWQSRRGEYIRATAPISMWEHLFDTDFYVWEDVHHDQQREYHRAHQYSLPHEVADHIDSVFHTVQIPPVINAAKRKRRNNVYKSRLLAQGLRSAASTDYASVTISYLNSYYEIASNLGKLRDFFGFSSSGLW